VGYAVVFNNWTAIFYFYNFSLYLFFPFITEGFSAKVLVWGSPQVMLTNAVKVLPLKGLSEGPINLCVEIQS
jgi:hypothetical protein